MRWRLFLLAALHVCGEAYGRLLCNPQCQPVPGFLRVTSDSSSGSASSQNKDPFSVRPNVSPLQRASRRAFSSLSEEAEGNGGERGAVFSETLLPGSYCPCVARTERLASRSVVIGGGEKGAALFDLLNGRSVEEQRRALAERVSLFNSSDGSAASSSPLLLGCLHPVAVQTMTNSDTRDVEATVEQIRKCAAAGASLVRLTVQGPKEAEASARIVERLRDIGCTVPLAADIHFQPKVASLCADVFDKVRINPGNFVDGRKVWEEEGEDAETAQVATQISQAVISDGTEEEASGRRPLSESRRKLEEACNLLGCWGEGDLAALLPSSQDRQAFRDGQQRIEEAFTPLVEKCLRQKKALRIGTNHGSVSARILKHFGDTPLAMVLSALEFADICVRKNFFNFVFSLKSSNPQYMQQAYRLMAKVMAARGALFPLHLGVTEAGEGEDGRVKSAAGIGSLLQDGIGDTVRVSLTEPPWAEIPVGRFLTRIQRRKLHAALHPPPGASIPAFDETTRDFADLSKPALKLRPLLHSQKTADTDNKNNEDNDMQSASPALHRDGSVVVSVSFSDLLKPDELYSALNLRRVGGVPLRTPRSADAVYVQSIFIEPPTGATDEAFKIQRSVAMEQEMETARKTVASLQQAGLSVWSEASDIQELQMSREQTKRELKGEALEEALADLKLSSLFMPGLVAVQRLRDAVAVAEPLASSYLQDIGGRVLVADGAESEEEIKAALALEDVLSFAIKPRDRLASGIAAGRRIADCITKLSAQDSGGLAPEKTLDAPRLPILQWVEPPPTNLLEPTPEDKDDRLLDVKQSEATTLFAAWEAGSLLLDRLADGVVMDMRGLTDISSQLKLGLGLLQGCRLRSTRTEFISCPSCGRTLFDIQKVSSEIRARVGHLPGVTVAVMGCIVNGIGEMGDADFGYVGGAPGLVDLYYRKELVRRGVRSEEACDALVELIKSKGRWVEPESDED